MSDVEFPFGPIPHWIMPKVLLPQEHLLIVFITDYRNELEIFLGYRLDYGDLWKVANSAESFPASSIKWWLRLPNIPDNPNTNSVDSSRKLVDDP